MRSFIFSKRATILAKLRHDALPEELTVKEIMVTKGKSEKRIRIMGRGRTGFGYQRWAHVRLKLELIDFQNMIEQAKTENQKGVWKRRYEQVQRLKSGSSRTQSSPTSTSSSNAGNAS